MGVSATGERKARGVGRVGCPSRSSPGEFACGPREAKSEPWAASASRPRNPRHAHRSRYHYRSRPRLTDAEPGASTRRRPRTRQRAARECPGPSGPSHNCSQSGPVARRCPCRTRSNPSRHRRCLRRAHLHLLLRLDQRCRRHHGLLRRQCCRPHRPRPGHPLDLRRRRHRVHLPLPHHQHHRCRPCRRCLPRPRRPRRRCRPCHPRRRRTRGCHWEHRLGDQGQCMRRRRHRSGTARRRFLSAANRTHQRRCRSSGRSRCPNRIRCLGRCPRHSQNISPRDWPGCMTRTCRRTRSHSTRHPRRSPRRRRWR